MEWVVSSTPRPFYPGEIPGTHCTGCWVDPTAGVDGCGKSRPPSGFDPRTIQPVASSYTDSYPGPFRYSKLVNHVPLYEHIPSFVHPYCGDVLFLVLPVVAVFQMHDGTIPFATCSKEDFSVCVFTAGGFNQLH